jgi:hypothetical protein
VLIDRQGRQRERDLELGDEPEEEGSVGQ